MLIQLIPGSFLHPAYIIYEDTTLFTVIWTIMFAVMSSKQIIPSISGLVLKFGILTRRIFKTPHHITASNLDIKSFFYLFTQAIKTDWPISPETYVLSLPLYGPFISGYNCHTISLIIICIEWGDIIARSTHRCLTIY